MSRHTGTEEIPSLAVCGEFSSSSIHSDIFSDVQTIGHNAPNFSDEMRNDVSAATDCSSVAKYTVSVHVGNSHSVQKDQASANDMKDPGTAAGKHDRIVSPKGNGVIVRSSSYYGAAWDLTSPTQSPVLGSKPIPPCRVDQDQTGFNDIDDASMVISGRHPSGNGGVISCRSESWEVGCPKETPVQSTSA